MDRKLFVAIGVRLFAIALAIYSLKSMPGMYIYFDNENYQSAAFMFAGLFVFLMLLAIFLWKFPLTVASNIIPNVENDEKSTTWNEKKLLVVGLILMGVYFFYYVISDAIYWLYIWNYSQSYTGMEIELNTEQKASIITTGVELIVSMLLIFGAKGVSNIIWHLRYAGKHPSNQ
ncbi:MAG: hypothetical protein KUF79_00835 [Candidatus Thiodiazotropha sp. (ex Ctena orbiculata)]|nr:hypothetical protein [Candidatus Thiodiazotropha taylori]